MRGKPTTLAGLTVLAGWASTACHVTVRSETTRPGATERIVHPDGAIGRPPALVLTEAGRLRFIEPLACPSEVIVRQHTTVELATRPNLATFTVGVIAAAAGGLMATSGLFSNAPSANPYTYAGIAGAGVGLALVIGPWIGNRTELREPRHGEAPRAVRRPGPREPCGARPLAARSATLAVDGLEVHGAIDRDGMFAISPYQWIDAYAAASIRATELTATVEGDDGRRTITVVLEAGTVAQHAAAFLARADFDAGIQPLRTVPGVAAGALRASLVATDTGPALRVVLALRNEGPGDAWGLRGQILAPATPSIDGRILYVGKLARGAAVTRELVIPLATNAANALRGARIELAVELRDAHGTAPATPVTFRGPLLADPVR